MTLHISREKGFLCFWAEKKAFWVFEPRKRRLSTFHAEANLRPSPVSLNFLSCAPRLQKLKFFVLNYISLSKIKFLCQKFNFFANNYISLSNFSIFSAARQYFRNFISLSEIIFLCSILQFLQMNDKTLNNFVLPSGNWYCILQTHFSCVSQTKLYFLSIWTFMFHF